MKTLVFKFTDKQFVIVAHVMHELLLQNYLMTNRLKVLHDGIFDERIKILLLWELYMRIAKRAILKQARYKLVLTEVQYMAFFWYFNPRISELKPYESAIFQGINDKVHQNLS